jgi:hypothetical protein
MTSLEIFRSPEVPISYFTIWKLFEYWKNHLVQPTCTVQTGAELARPAGQIPPKRVPMPAMPGAHRAASVRSRPPPPTVSDHAHGPHSPSAPPHALVEASHRPFLVKLLPLLSSVELHTAPP